MIIQLSAAIQRFYFSIDRAEKKTNDRNDEVLHTRDARLNGKVVARYTCLQSYMWLDGSGASCCCHCRSVLTFSVLLFD